VLAPKSVELMREMLPHARRIGLLGDPSEPRWRLVKQALAVIAADAKLTTIEAETSSASTFDAAVARLIEQKVDVIFGISTTTWNLRERLMRLAAQAGVPVFGSGSEMADAGALFSCNTSLSMQLHRSTHLFDKVPRGTPPADIPVEQPTTFELVVNLHTARALGIVVPQMIPLCADRVIE
jgi:putative ABC transport system substrate-binding protein